MNKPIWMRKDWPSFYWTNSVALENKINDLHDLRSAYVLQISGLAASVDSLEKKDPFAIFKTVETDKNERFFSLKTEIEHITKWWALMPEELDPFIRAGVVAFWCEVLFYNQPDAIYVSDFLARSCFLKNSESEFLVHTLLSKIKNKKSAYLLAIESASFQSGDLTEWLFFYFDLLADFFSENVEDNGALAFRDDFSMMSLSKLNLRQKKFLAQMNDSLPVDFKITNLYYSGVCGCSRETAKRDLRLLVNAGFLVLHSAGRGVWYGRKAAEA